MMQHVATAKSEVAAFATRSQTDSFAGADSSEQFSQVLQDQKSNHSATIAPESPSPQSPRKTKLQQEIDETKTYPSSGHSEETKTKPKSTSNEHTASLSQGEMDKDAVTKSDVKQEADLLVDLPSKHDDIGSELAAESGAIVAQDWVDLVAKLADIARPNHSPLVDSHVVADNSSLIQTETVDEGNVSNEALLAASTKKDDQASLNVYLQQALETLTAKADKDQVSSAEFKQKAAELLLDQSEVLQDLASKLPLANQQRVSDITESTDFGLPENKALLRSLLVDVNGENTPIKQPVELPEPASFGTPDKSEKTTSTHDIKNILNLTDTKIDKVLEDIAQRVFDSKQVVESNNPERLVQQIATPKAAEIIHSVASPAKEFVATLKAGLEEFKQQLSQGREPGIDLKALVSDALTKTADAGVVVKAPANLEQMVSSVSQMLDVAQTVNRAIEQHHDQVYSATVRDVAQVQGEQSKQIQLNQFESKFEKAVNLAKPEGHQQLAEKVRWMVNAKNLVAEIRLDPAELGSMHVKVAVSGESATVNFVVQSQQARDAVDTATPRLREMLAEKGIELGQSSVQQESAGQEKQGEFARQGGGPHSEVEDVDVPEQILGQQSIVNGSLGGIDYFV